MDRKLKLITTGVCLCLLSALAIGQNLNSEEKWSRQVESSGSADSADSFDWVPVAQPVDGGKDRSSNARVLTYSQTFPPNAKIGELPKHQHQHQHLGFPYQLQRFPSQHLQQHHAPQAGPLRHHSKANDLPLQQPTSQSFFKFEMPSYHSDGSRQESGPPVQTGYQIHHSFSGGGGGSQAAFFSPPLFSHKPVFPPEFHPGSLVPHRSHNQPIAQKQIQQNFIEDISPVSKNQFREVKPLATNEALATVAPQTFPVQQEPEELRSSFELQRPSSFQQHVPFHGEVQQAAPQQQIQNSQDQQEVQLVYVPYDTLYNPEQSHLHQAPNPAANQIFDVSRYNDAPGSVPIVNPYQVNSFYTPETLQQQDPQAYTTSTTHRPTTTSTSTSTASTTLKPSRPYQNFENQEFSSFKQKPKAHQPPLAMFLYRNSARPTQTDVVAALRNSHNIAVLDAPTKQTPNIFIGPAGMPTPSGFAKFELPYLSQIDQSRNLHDVPFFVAPLSYRTQNGFNKILLPEPHVGSIVVNKGLDTFDYSRGQQQQQQSIPQHVNPNNVYITPSQNEVSQQQHQSTTPHGRPISTTLRVKGSSMPKDFYPELIREVLSTHQQKFADQARNPYGSVSGQRESTTPSRGHKWHDISQATKNYYQEPIQEVPSPKVAKQKHRPHYQQQNDNNVYSQSPRPYAQFNPMPNNIVNEDYFKVQPIKNTHTSTTSTSTSSSTSTSTSPSPYYTQSYQTSPQVEFQSTSGQLYPEIYLSSPASPTPASQTVRTKHTQSNDNDEEYRMKQYFRQQDAFRKRPQASASTSTPSTPFESIRYTPVSLDYDREVRIPSSTSPYYTTPAPRTSTPKQRITFYSPAPTTTNAPLETDFNTVLPNEQQQVVEFSRDSDTQTQTPDRSPPSNHRPTYNNNEVEFDPNPYQLPSELPPLAPNLPGLVNSLQEKDKQNAIENQESGVTSSLDGQTRPLNRSRKPAAAVVSKVSSSVSYSTTETSTRRPINRVRRPYGTRNYTTSTTTTRPSTSRKPIIRNPNRIRYNPTPEERQSLRIKTRKNGNGSKKASETEDLDYQRDVLKQNYPIIKPSSSSSSSSKRVTGSTGSGSGTTDRPGGSESQQIYTVTPSSTSATGDNGFLGLLEPMQIAQQYQEYSKDNFGPGLFPKEEEDNNPTESIARNEISPIYTTIASSTITTTTTEANDEPAVTTRRTPFIRRGPRIRTTTTTEPPTAAASEERHTIRPRIPPRKVIKVRARTRKPAHPASTTAAPEEDGESEPEIIGKGSYRKLHRFNQDLYQDEQAQRRVRPNSHFQLDGQESQWSPSLSSKGNNNNFKPLNLKERVITAELKFAKEPEIVTANPNESDSKKPETYEFNVSAGFGPTASSFTASNNTKSEKSFADLIEEVMGSDAEDSKAADTEVSTKPGDGTFFESQKTDITNRLNRRGKWKKVRVHHPPNESFETAESQNIGSQLFNSLYTGSLDKSTEAAAPKVKTLTTTTQSLENIDMETTESPDFMDFELTTKIPETTTTTSTTTTTKTTPAPPPPPPRTTQIPLDDFPFDGKKSDPSESEEMATRRNDNEDLTNVDDLEGQSSLFSEVRKQLSDLFAIEEDDETLTAATVNNKARHEYTNIQRIRTEATTTQPTTATATAATTTIAATTATPDTVTAAAAAAAATTTTLATDQQQQSKTTFHKDLMNSVVYATSTSTKVTSETEICYRGRCIRSEDLPPNHKLH